MNDKPFNLTVNIDMGSLLSKKLRELGGKDDDENKKEKEHKKIMKEKMSKLEQAINGLPHSAPTGMG